MPATIEYALLATNAYARSDQVVHRNNEVLPPSEWNELDLTQRSNNNGANTATGFLARAYRGGTGEIVIAYGGTTNEDGMKTLDWTKGNIPAATAASLAEQIVDAARFYLDIRKANPTAAISFTGHSLGGGLASLMAVLFDKNAWTFDQAPFEASAKSASIVDQLRRELATTYDINALAPELRDYQAGTTNLDRESRVRHTYVEGEILRNFPAYVATVGGLIAGPLGAGILGGVALASASEIAAPNPDKWDFMATGVTAVDLHGMRLLVAVLQSPALKAASQANPDFLANLLSSPLVAGRDQKRDAKNFLNLMLQQEVLGNKPLDRLAEDISKFTGTLDPVASNFTNADAGLKNSLYQLAVALYHIEGTKGSGAFQNQIKSETGGIQFQVDPAGGEDYKQPLADVLNELGMYSDFGQVKNYLTHNAERYTLPTSGAVVAAGAGDKKDLMLGSGQGDTLTGGGGNDTLLGVAGGDALDGGVGEDILFGGKDNDTLIGGEGDDTYLFQAGYGQDTVIDASGSNRILLGSGLDLGTTYFARQGDDLQIVALTSADRLTVKDWYATDAHFVGLTLGDGTELDRAGVEAAMPRNDAPVANPDSGVVIEDDVLATTHRRIASTDFRVANDERWRGAA